MPHSSVWKRKSRKVKKRCETCGKSFLVDRYRKNTARFCTLACLGKYHGSRHEKDPRKWEVRECQWCGRDFSAYRVSSQVYCSRECAYASRHSPTPKRFIKVCLQCKNEFQSKRRQTIFCSANCFHTWFKEHHTPWNKGKSNCYSDVTLDKMRAARQKQRFPTSKTLPELNFERICNACDLPFKYVGNGAAWVGSLNPDFIERSGKPIAVDIFGDYWHSPLRKGILYCATERGRVEVFQEYGWKLIIFWENELKCSDALDIVYRRLEEHGALTSMA